MNSAKTSPIVLFVFNRLKETKLTVDALSKNALAKDSILYVFSDGPRNKKELKKVDEVRSYLNNIHGKFSKVIIHKSENNKGLANSVIAGVSHVLSKHEEVIVLEDDLVSSKNFLHFMNQALTFYKNTHKVFSISGYTFDLAAAKKEKQDFYFGYRASSWGWATWKDRWNKIDWNNSYYENKLKNVVYLNKLRRGGNDMPKMLKNHLKGKIDSWAIRYCAHQSWNDLFTVFPKISKIQSIGFSKEATHTKNKKRFETVLDKGVQTDFLFSSQVQLNSKINRQFKSKFSTLYKAITFIKSTINN